MKNKVEVNPRLGVVGGQAVLEGVMMRLKTDILFPSAAKTVKLSQKTGNSYQ